MRSADRPSFTIKRACSPLKEEDGNVMVDSRSVSRKKAKFKSPVPIAYRTMSENPVVSSCKWSSNTRDDGDKQHVFGTDASGVQSPFESSNHDHTSTETSEKSYAERMTAMPGFGGILADIYQICPDTDVKNEPFGAMSDFQKKTESQPRCEDLEADDDAIHREKNISENTLEKKYEMDRHDASIDSRTEASRLSAVGARSTSATHKCSVFSKFKMPARVKSAGEIGDELEITPDVPGTPSNPQRFRTPDRSSSMPLSQAKANETPSTIEEKIASDFYCVMFCIRKPNAKHKGPWSDGVLIRRGRSSVLHDSEGKLVLKDIEQRGGALSEGTTLLMGKYELEVMSISTEEAFVSGKLFQGTGESSCAEMIKVVQRRPFKSFQAPSVKLARVSTDKVKVTPSEAQTTKVNPALERHVLVLNAGQLQRGCPPVVVDPYLASKLRPHQQEGVKFIYECVMGMRHPIFTGCLLADAMGLGKTLQVIALIWTLIKQGPGGHPAVSRVLVICPSSLVENWGKEVRKWLGNERLTPLIIHSGTPAKDVKRKILNFQVGKVYPLLITSYELVRKHIDDLNTAKPELLVCDEAHRLKNCAGNKTIDSLLALPCSKRLILTGTPIQNDLLEFYAMIDFVNPNLLGSLSTFKRLYAQPIEKSRDRDSSEKEKILGRARLAELQSMTRFCILQRAANVNAKYLPAKTEYVVFCMLQKSQVSLYRNFLKSKVVSDSLATGQSACVLSAIGTLRKLCNHPVLVEHELSKGNVNATGVSTANGDDGLKAHSGEANRRTSADWRLSGKLSCLQRLISAIHSTTSGFNDKVVVVSNFTQTLDIVQIMCEGQGWRWLRLDGATNVSERQSLVDHFNSNDSDFNVFLLSSKAGGSGLNLVGANRLVLFDPDWNPATDAQAMARVWRDGQRKPVFIYRLLTTASIEEKIFQRQMMKGEVAAALEERVEGHFLDSDSGGRRHFSREELRELFNLNLETSCDTYDLLSLSESSSSDSWRDYSNDVEDHALKAAIRTGVVTFVHQKTYLKEVFSPLDNVHKVGDSKLEDQTGTVDTKQPQLSSFASDDLVDEIDDRPLDCGRPLFDPHRDIDSKRITLDCEPTKSTMTNLWKEENLVKDLGDESYVHSVATDVFLDDEDDPKLKCKEVISRPLHRERNDIVDSKAEFLERRCSSGVSSNIENAAEKKLNYNKEEATVSENLLAAMLDASGDKSLAAKTLSIVSEREHNCRRSGSVRKQFVQIDDVRILEECEEQTASEHECEQQQSVSVDDDNDRLASKTPSRINILDKGNASSNANSEDKSSAALRISDDFDCLLERRSQNIMNLMLNSSVPVDDFDDDDLEDLDAPFLCSLDLEIEMKRAHFVCEDLWQGFKLFAIGFLLEEKETMEAYRNSKLGQILDKCNPDKITDDESLFCKAFPIIRAALSKRYGRQASDLSHLFSTFEQQEDLKTTFSGRFTIALMRHFDGMRTSRDEQS